MKASKEQTDLSSFLVMGAEFVENDWHKGEILVNRRGLLRPQYSFLHNDKQIATLKWQRSRLGIYEAKGIKLELSVATMGKVIYAKDELSSLSRLMVKSPVNARKAKMVIQLADSDGFIVQQRSDAHGDNFSLYVTKKHYVSKLVNFEFSLEKKQRSHTIARIHVPSIMRWEAQHFHHLLALIMGHITFLQEHGLSHNHQNHSLLDRTTTSRR
jgi:hypothetical protein